MNSFEQSHLISWCAEFGDDDGFDLFIIISDFVRQHPDVIERNLSWSDIRDLARRQL